MERWRITEALRQFKNVWDWNPIVVQKRFLKSKKRLILRRCCGRREKANITMIEDSA